MTRDCSVLDKPETLNILLTTTTGLLLAIAHAFGLLLNIIGLVLMERKKKTPLFFYCSMEFCRFISIGAIFSHIAAVTWVIQPSMVICIARPVSATLAFSIFFGALFIKTYRLDVILRAKGAPDKGKDFFYLDFLK